MVWCGGLIVGKKRIMKDGDLEFRSKRFKVRACYTLVIVQDCDFDRGVQDWGHDGRQVKGRDNTVLYIDRLRRNRIVLIYAKKIGGEKNIVSPRMAGNPLTIIK